MVRSCVNHPDTVFCKKFCLCLRCGGLFVFFRLADILKHSFTACTDFRIIQLCFIQRHTVILIAGLTV